MLKFRYAVAAVTLIAALSINLAALAARAAARTSAQAANRAGLVIQFQDGSLLTRCVSFSEPQITGYDLLRRANVSLIADFGSGGTTVCKIAKTGCNYPVQNCFCDCQDLNNACTYWMYYFQAGGAWKYAALGAALQKVGNGDVNGWIYGLGGSSSGGAAPPLVSFDEVCGGVAIPAPTIAPTTTVAPDTAPPVTATPAPIPTAVPEPTQAPSATPAPPTAAIPALSSTPVQYTATAAVMSLVTATPTPAPTKIPSPTPAPAATRPPPATPAAEATSTPVPQGASSTTSNGLGYVVFAGIAIVLVGALILSRRGQATRGPGK